MAKLPAQAFNLAIVDPPYFKKVGNGTFHGTGLSGTGRKRGNYKKIDSWDENIPTNDYYKELCRVSKNQIIWGINYFPDFRDVPVGRIIWDKKNDQSTYSKAEIASCTLHDSVQMFRYLWNGMFQENMKIKEIRIHPTQKPVQLYKWLLSKYANPGDSILDTHLGSGSLAIACHSYNFDFVGCEIDKPTYTGAVKRYNDFKKQSSLFG